MVMNIVDMTRTYSYIVLVGYLESEESKKFFRPVNCEGYAHSSLRVQRLIKPLVLTVIIEKITQTPSGYGGCEVLRDISIQKKDDHPQKSNSPSDIVIFLDLGKNFFNQISESPHPRKKLNAKSWRT